MNEIRLLKAGEIECRVGQCGRSQKGVAWCSLLLYKDARCDMRVMDETFGVMGWRKSYELINGNLFCTVSVRDEKTGEWIAKQDVGVESNTEKEKGQASDAFKRACVNWGIGRELYTAPKIFITLNNDEVVDRNGKPSLAPKVVFTVAEIGYDESRNINALVIVDNSGVVRYKIGQVAPAQSGNAAVTDEEREFMDTLTGYILPSLEQCHSEADVKKVWDEYSGYQGTQKFINVINARLAEIRKVA